MEYLDAYILRLKHLLRFRIFNEDRKTTGLLTTGHRTTGLQEKWTSINWSFRQLVLLTTGLLDYWSFGQLSGLLGNCSQDQFEKSSKRPLVQKISYLEVQLSIRPV